MNVSDIEFKSWLPVVLKFFEQKLDQLLPDRVQLSSSSGGFIINSTYSDELWKVANLLLKECWTLVIVTYYCLYFWIQSKSYHMCVFSCLKIVNLLHINCAKFLKKFCNIHSFPRSKILLVLIF